MRRSSVGTVLRKELLDGRRDKRAILSALLFPLGLPLFVYFVLNAIVDISKDLEEIELPIVGAENAPALIDWLEQRGVKLTSVEGDPIEAVKSKSRDLVLVIPEDFQSRFAQSRSASVELINDGSRTSSRAEVNKVRSLLNGYSTEIGALRLVSRGISPEIVRSVTVENIEVASKQQISARALNFIPMYVVMAAFICGMGVAIDSTAGERERSTLEALLLNPVERSAIVIGKWLAASLFAAVGVVLTMATCLLVLQRVPLEEIGLSLHVGTREMVGMLAAVLPLAFMATGLQVLLGTFARSFKDAQSYIGFLILIPVIPGMMSTFYPIKSAGWMNFVPALGQHVLLMDVLGGKAPPIWGFVVAGITALIVGFACVRLTAHLFRKERIVFSH